MDAIQMSNTAQQAFDAIWNALQANFSVTNLIALIVSVLGVTSVFGIIWFIKGYVSRRVAGAFKSGNI